MTQFIIKSHNDAVTVQRYLAAHMQNAINENKPLVVRINQKQDDYTTQQRRLYWMWMQEWAQHQGTTKDYEHLFFKRKFLSVIYFRDDVGQYRKTFNAVKQLRDEKHPMYEKVAEGLNELVSITDSNVKQFKEYLDEIHTFCLKHGKYLAVPDDLKFLSEMG